MKCSIDCMTNWLVVMGGVNWGLFGLMKMDLVAMMFGGMPMVAQAMYVMIGMSAVYMAWKMVSKE